MGGGKFFYVFVCKNLKFCFSINSKNVVYCFKNTFTFGSHFTPPNFYPGKTAVIAPAFLSVAGRICRNLSDQKTLVRATVLPSLYQTNAADWQHKLGGLVDRRIYPLMCRRDLELGPKEAKNLVQLCERMRSRGDVLVTVPEHRLSLENKATELASEYSR